MRILTPICLGLALTACNSTPEGDSGVAEMTPDISALEQEYSCDEASVLCVALAVPETYAGDPRNLFVGLYDSLPPAGPPTVFLMDEDAPEFVPGDVIELSLRDDVPDSGEYFIFSGLYDQNGGEWMPEPGIDYVATSAEPYAFDGAGKDVGEVAFSLYDGE